MKICEKKCVLSIKRQHKIDQDIPDVVLDSSLLETSREKNVIINGSQLNVRSESPNPTSTNQNTDSDNDSESESEAEPPSPTPGLSHNQSGDPRHINTEVTSSPVSSPASVRQSADSPVPGPSGIQSNVAYFEDVTFEPLVTSTPHVEGNVDDVNEQYVDEGENVGEEDDQVEGDKEDEGDLWDMVDLQEVHNKFQEGKEEVKFIKTDFLNDVKAVIKLKSKLYVPKLRKRRSKFLKQLKKLAKHKVKVDNLFRTIRGGIRNIDKEIEDFQYFAENFPGIAEQQQQSK